jgi:hypothetical protein
MRKRIQTQLKSIEKVTLSHLKAFQVKARSKNELKDKLNEYEKYRHGEIIRMFKSMSYNTELDERRECRYLSKVQTKDTIVTVNRTVVVPTSYEILNDTVLGMYRIGKNFVKRTIKKAEVVPVIDWNTLKSI